MSFRIDQLAVLNLATVGNSITAGSFVKSGGTSSQFLKADGTVDTNAYITGITSGMVTTALGYTPVPNTRNITINGVTQDLSVDRTWTISAGVSSVTGSGSGISVSPTTGAVVISNTGVTSNVAGTGISVSGATGAVTITNTGVTSIVAGTAITISGATGAVTINNTGVTSLNGSTGALTGFATQAWVTSQGYITSASVGNGTLTLNVSGNGLSGSQTFTANQSTAATFTVTSNATTAATANTLVYRDASGHITGNYGFFAYVNTSDNDETGITRFVIKNGDNYHRSATTTTAMTVIRGVASGTWGISITGSAGSASTASQVTHNASRTDGTWYNIGWFAGNPSPAYSCDSVQILSSAGAIRANIYYDNDNTAYYLNPASGSTSLRIAGGIAQNDIVGRPAAYWGSTGTTGAVVIKFPGNTGNYGMIHAVIDIYEYNGNDACTVIVGGHNWGGAWYNYGAQVVGSTDKPVRVGVKDGQYCIVIGNGSSSWSYGQVVLRKIQNGTYYSGVMDIAGGYTVAIESDTYSWISSDLRNLETPLNFYAGSNIYMGGNIVATQSWVNSQGFVTGGPFVPVSGGVNMTGSYGLNDSRLYLRTNGDTNHYLWNAGDDWEELGAYAGTGFRVTSNNGANGLLYVYGSSNGGYTYSPYSFRAPIFYDSDDTSYYADFHSTSQSAIRVRGGALHGPNPTWGKYLLVGGDGRQGYIDNTDVASVSTTNGNLHIDAASGYGTYINWYDGSELYFGRGNSGAASAFVNSSGNWNFGNTSSASYLIHARGDIYADGGWVRVSGTSGLYFESYAGGWHMTDSTYVRSYNGKNVHMNSANIDYVGSIYFNSGPATGYLLGNTGGSYGSLQINGAKNGWYGLNFESGNTLMMNNNESGHHQQGVGWKWRWYNGQLYVSRGSTGGGAEYTVWDSGNASRAGNSLLMYYQGFTLDANTMDGNSSGFTYSNNAPFTGPVIRISETGYSLWFNAAYAGGGTQLAFRTRNGDSATLNPWRTILHDANYNSYAPTLTGGGASGTWSINITGSAGSVDFNNLTNKTGGTGTYQTSGDFRAPIFYDSDNTAYYCDPASTSVLNTISSYAIYNTSLGAGYYFTAGDWGWRHQTPSGWIQFGPANTGHAHIYTDRSNFYFNVDLLYLNGYIVPMYGYNRTGDLYASRYYDANDTGYYLDPASESNLWRFTAQSMTRNAINYLSINSPYSTRAGQAGPYLNGTMGWGQIDFNTIFSNWGSGFIDTWSNPGNAPGGSSHYVGIQGLHYNHQNNTNGYGFQMACAGEADNRFFWRSAWPNLRSWVEMMHSANSPYAWNMNQYVRTTDNVTFAAIYSNDWFRANGCTGFYFQSYGHGLRAPECEGNNYGNVCTYGGGRNGWAGYGITASFTMMGRSGTDVGLHDNGSSWIFYSPYGTQRLGFGTSTTSASYRIYVSGAIYATGDVVAYSDRRKKTDIVTIDNALEKVTNLRGVFYTKIGEEKKGRKTGVIAQEINEVLPEVVTYASDTDEYGVSYGNIAGVLIEAIKEQNELIKTLKSEIDQLKAKLE